MTGYINLICEDLCLWIESLAVAAPMADAPSVIVKIHQVIDIVIRWLEKEISKEYERNVQSW
jgi:hypothetical protein